MSTKYKGKNVRVSDSSHEILINLGPKINMGAWVDEAIKEKIEREKKEKKEYSDFGKPNQ
ncbi:MAG TPA: hypothetical protein PLZ45_06760 [Ferruginibacter sp.]|nr:hypothetical protein [Ferruginibacter sp.]